jgi:tetrathionate reductase subunit B
MSDQRIPDPGDHLDMPVDAEPVRDTAASGAVNRASAGPTSPGFPVVEAGATPDADETTEAARAGEPVEPGQAIETTEAARAGEPGEPGQAIETTEAARAGEPAAAAHTTVALEVTELAAPTAVPVEPEAAPSAPSRQMPAWDLVPPGDLVPADDTIPVAPDVEAPSVSRRAFLGFGLALLGGLAGAATLARLFPVFEDPTTSVSPIVPSYDPATKAWAFVVDTSACIGCGLCVVACKEENHVPEDGPFTRTWVERHVTTTDGATYVDSPQAGIHGFPPESTAPGAEGKAVTAAWFMPRLCMQCENSPCTSVCPVGATYRTADGVILVDSRRCIGCGYCVVACPYGARYLTPAGEEVPRDTPGVADKCNWCYHRISRGRQPACVEVCPIGARRFGDVADPSDELTAIVRDREPRALYPEYGTRPRVLYLGPSVEEA